MALDPLTYPRPRLRRAGPPTSATTLAESLAGAPPAPPRTRLIPFSMQVNATQRRSMSAGPFVGPAIVTALEYYTGGASDPLNQTLELGTSLTSVTENGVALTTVRPYTVLTERLDAFGIAAANAGQGFLNWTIPGAPGRYQYKLSLVIELTQFFLVIAMPNAAVATIPIGGHVVLLEAVSLDALASYLGN